MRQLGGKVCTYQMNCPLERLYHLLSHQQCGNSRPLTTPPASEISARCDSPATLSLLFPEHVAVPSIEGDLGEWVCVLQPHCRDTGSWKAQTTTSSSLGLSQVQGQPSTLRRGHIPEVKDSLTPSLCMCCFLCPDHSHSTPLVILTGSALALPPSPPPGDLLCSPDWARVQFHSRIFTPDTILTTLCFTKFLQI